MPMVIFIRPLPAILFRKWKKKESVHCNDILVLPVVSVVRFILLPMSDEGTNFSYGELHPPSRPLTYYFWCTGATRRMVAKVISAGIKTKAKVNKVIYSRVLIITPHYY
jgi:hypothetical protein